MSRIILINKMKIAAMLMVSSVVVCCSNTDDNFNYGGGETLPPEKSDVECYTTSANGSNLFAPQYVRFVPAEMSQYRITVNPEVSYQSIDGFGPAITGATCHNLMKMPPENRTKLLRQCFDPKQGLGFSFIRVHIGGSDFSMDEYTCCDREGIENFEIPRIEQEEIFPVLKEILSINPDVKILGSPWSCPRWMKGRVDNPSKPYNSWTSGRLNPKYYADYAQYFVKWIRQMEENGFRIHAITMQNEPLNKGNSMSLYMPWEDQAAFVKHLGPAFEKAGIKTKILAYDHNYNYDNIASQRDYPLHLYADSEASKWIDGSAWHNYGGSETELDHILRMAPDKSIYFTEASIGEWNYSFDKCLINDFVSVFLGTLSRQGKGVLLWNMMLDDKKGPNRPGGCTSCFGAIEISSKDYSTLKYNSHYYDMAHCSKVILPGAKRIATDGFLVAGLVYEAFLNPDGSLAFVAVNKNDHPQNIAVFHTQEDSFKYTIQPQSIVSFRWNAPSENNPQ